MDCGVAVVVNALFVVAGLPLGVEVDFNAWRRVLSGVVAGNMGAMVEGGIGKSLLFAAPPALLPETTGSLSPRISFTHALGG